MEHLTLYVREGCHLCDDALDVLRDVRHAVDFGLDVVDVGGQAGLEALYGQRVPVLARGDEVIAQYAIEADMLVAWLAARR